MCISQHSGISPLLGPKEHKSRVKWLFSRKTHLFSFAATGENTERENRNNRYRVGDLRKNVKRKTRWYSGNKAVPRNETGSRMQSDIRTLNLFLYWMLMSNAALRDFVPVEALKSAKSYPLLWSKTRNIRKPQSIDVWICSWAVFFLRAVAQGWVKKMK